MFPLKGLQSQQVPDLEGFNQCPTESRCFLMAAPILLDWGGSAGEQWWPFSSGRFASNAAWQILAPRGESGPPQSAPASQRRCPKLISQSLSNICQWLGRQSSNASHSLNEGLCNEIHADKNNEIKEQCLKRIRFECSVTDHWFVWMELVLVIQELVFSFLLCSFLFHFLLLSLVNKK